MLDLVELASCCGTRYTKVSDTKYDLQHLKSTLRNLKVLYSSHTTFFGKTIFLFFHKDSIIFQSLLNHLIKDEIKHYVLANGNTICLCFGTTHLKFDKDVLSDVDPEKFTDKIHARNVHLDFQLQNYNMYGVHWATYLRGKDSGLVKPNKLVLGTLTSNQNDYQNKMKSLGFKIEEPLSQNGTGYLIHVVHLHERELTKNVEEIKQKISKGKEDKQ